LSGANRIPGHLNVVAHSDLGGLRHEYQLSKQVAWFAVAQKVRHAAGQPEDHQLFGLVGRARGTLELVIPGLPYIVTYGLKGKAVQILSVFHAARKWPEELSRMQLK